MRVVAVVMLIVACVAGAAVAQVSGVYDTSNVQWEREVDIRAGFLRYMPERAANEQLSGAASVCCTVDRSRRLDCVTARETQEGYGFGQSTVRFMRLYQMTDASYAAWQADPRPIARTMNWHFGNPDPQRDARFAQFRSESAGLCAASSSQSDGTAR